MPTYEEETEGFTSDSEVDVWCKENKHFELKVCSNCGIITKDKKK